ncbi:MAS20-domain-containing protein [Trametes coccinea BRFM310]|uniref:MAS20-domain-containing protein n=1 Tax=Trametes coccinea (strain BRFM310) TaxID=1353009 RepID=A0A1Y2ICY2_TRAC3|nr:MAS20-domain-containing protein [Trametes coccinea BRFM310]
MSSSRTSTIFTVAAVTVLGGLVAYAVYFDYKRRNDTEFRKKLRKEKKKVTKKQAEQAQAQAQAEAANPAEIKAMILKLQGEELPATPDEKEQYFVMQVQLGEQMAQQGPAFYMPAAAAFFRALRVYPSPVEFIMMVQSTLPQPIFKIFMELVNAEAAARIEGYYDHFPPRRMNVTVQTGPPQANQAAKKILVAEKDFEPGDVIYTEHPAVVALDADLEGKGTHCSYCFRPIEEGKAVTPEHDKLGSAYCSEECRTKGQLGWQNILFGLDPVLPPELDNGMSALTVDQRNKAQEPFTDFIKTKAKSANLLAARFVAKQIAHETVKLLPKKPKELEEELKSMADKDIYNIGDHVERLRFVEGHVTNEEVKLLGAVLGSALPGVEQSVTEERHAALVGKMAYNAIGVTPAGGRDDRPVPDARPEDLERTRTPHGTSRQLGSGIYLVSSYIAHSCDPNTTPTFPKGTNELHLVATKPIKKGDELTMAWVDVAPRDDVDAGLARRQRRIELARGWRFKCECARCLQETMDEMEKEADLAGVKGDESKVETFMRHEKAPGEGMGPD